MNTRAATLASLTIFQYDFQGIIMEHYLVAPCIREAGPKTSGV